MAKTNRDMMIRKQTQTVAAIEKAMYYLGDMKGTYGPTYPKHQLTLDTLGEMLSMALDLLHVFREEIM